MAQFAMFQLRGDELVTGVTCAECSLSESPNLRTNCMKGFGASRPTFLFVGVNPPPEDDAEGRPMTGSNGRIFWELVKEAGFEAREIFVTNATKCSAQGEEVKQSQWKACRHHLEKEIAELKPQVVVAVGAKAVEWLSGQKGVERLNRVRLSLAWQDDMPVYAMKQPMALKHVHGDERLNLRASMVADLVWLKQQVRYGLHNRRWEDQCDYQTAHTVEDLERFFAEIEAQPVLSCDLETVTPGFEKGSLEHDTGKIQAVGFSWGKGIGRSIPIYARGVNSYFWWQDGVIENIIVPRLQKIFREKIVFGQNFVQFDQKWIRTHFGIETCRIDFDTMYAHHILFPEANHGLEQMAMEFLGVPPWKQELSPTDTVRTCKYLCKDVDTAWQLRHVLFSKMQDCQKWLLSELLLPLGMELNQMELRGVRVSETDLGSIEEFLTRKIDEATARLRSFQEVQAFEFAQGAELNPDSSDQLRVLFQDYFRLPQVSTTGSGEYSTDKEWQEHHKSHPAVASLAKSRGLAKLKGTYCDGIRKRMRNGRIHTNFRIGPVTGRLASRDPNLQNIPRKDTAGKVLDDGNAIKKIFAADEGYALIQGDMSQAELRVLASVSGDPNLLEIFRRGQDVHRATAAKVYGIDLSLVTDTQRTNAKRTNFGIVYGMTKESLIAQFIEAGNTPKQAEDFYYGHQHTFPRVWSWMAEQESIIRRHRKQVTFFGRTRHYQFVDEAAIRQAYNFPIQSLASDLTEISIIRIAHELRTRQLDAYCLLTVHDSIVVQANLNQFWEVADILHSVMSGVNFSWMKVPMKADLEAGFTWGTMKKIDIATKSLVA